MCLSLERSKRWPDPFQVYIARRQSHIAQYVATYPLIEEAIGADRRSGSSFKRKFWWEQDIGGLQ